MLWSSESSLLHSPSENGMIVFNLMSFPGLMHRRIAMHVYNIDVCVYLARYPSNASISIQKNSYIT